MPDEKKFTIDVDAMLDMQVKRAEYLGGLGMQALKESAASKGDAIEAAAVGTLALGCIKAANKIERGVLEDYHTTRNIGADSSPDLQMIAEYIAEYHMDEIEEGMTVGAAAVQLLNNLKEQLNEVKD